MALGLAEVIKRSEELASQRTSFGLRKFTTEFRWDGNKPASENALCLRVLGDDIIVPTKMHRGVPLPDNKFFFGVCRKAYPIEADFCHVCDVMDPAFDGNVKAKKRAGLVPADVAAALALEMEQVMNGRVFVGYRPKMVEFEIPQVTEAEKGGEVAIEVKAYRELLSGLGQPGSKVRIPNIGLMVGTFSGQQALFDYATRRKTISDRVFEISRHGAALETKWDWNHEGPDQENPDPAELLKSFEGKYPFELPEEWAIRSGSEDRYNFFFKLGPVGEAAGESAVATPDDGDVDPVSDNRTALIERLKGNGKAASN